MPLLRNKHQPYFPDPDSPNNYQCGDEFYCNPVNEEDTIYNQWYQTPCGASLLEDPDFSDISLGSELITNGSFATATDWTLGSNWAFGTNQLDHFTGNLTPDNATQTGLAITAGNYYELTVDMSRTSGFITILLGGVAVATLTDTGLATFIVQAGNVNDHIVIQSSAAFTGGNFFNGSVATISLKEVTFGSWNPFNGWLLDGGLACPTTGLDLIETVPDYLIAGTYYQFTFSVVGYQQGTLLVYISNVLAATITSGGIHTIYATPTVDGVIRFSGSPSSVFCLDLATGSENYPAGIYALRNDYTADLINSAGDSVLPLDTYFNYTEDFVTLVVPVVQLTEGSGVAYGCYTIQAYDSCLITGQNLVENGNFAAAQDGWNGGSNAYQYDFTGGDLEMIFEPEEGTDYVTNGDFATGDFTGWTASGGLAVVANAVQHTPGTVDTLTQTLTLPPPEPPGIILNFFVTFTIIGRTAGTVGVTLGDVVRNNLSDNNQISFRMFPTVGGAQPLTFTFSSDFDGSVDDIMVFETRSLWTGAPMAFNAVNTLMVAGNYEISFEIIGSTDSRISVGVVIQGQTQPIVYRSTAGVHTFQINNYVPGSQRAVIVANFAFLNYSVLGSITVDNIVVRRIEPFDATYTSECLNIQLSHPKTMILQGFCDQNSLGFEFANSGFFLQMRALVRSIAPTYPNVTQIQKTGTGNARITYASVEKYWQLHTGFASESFHDALVVMSRCDHFLIGTAQDNGKEYIVQVEDYSPGWLGGGVYSLAPAVLNLRIKDGGEVFNRHI